MSSDCGWLFLRVVLQMIFIMHSATLLYHLTRMVAYSDVWLFSSCSDSNGIRYLMFDFAFLMPGALVMARGEKQD
jgi:hypothetical protein